MTEAYPLKWPNGKPRSKRQDTSRFNVSMAKARDDLFNELRLMGARYVVLSMNVPLRQDGLPYANFKQPDDKGVAIYFEYKGNGVCFACDRWNKVEDNVQAIKKTIEALRGISRWGTGDMVDAAFQGFEALPAPNSGEWFNILDVAPPASLEQIRLAFKHKYQQAETDDQRMTLNAAYQKGKEVAK